MTIHGIYLKNTPKNKWHLVSVANSPEAAIVEMNEILRVARNKGNDKAETACKTFDYAFHIPEYLSDIKNKIPLFN